MSEIVEFLRARIEEDQEWAETMGHSDPQGDGGFLACAAARTRPIGDLPYGPDKCDCHLDRIKGRALREVEAKRRVIDYMETEGAFHPDIEQYLPRLLALPYSDHRDYLEEWRP